MIDLLTGRGRESYSTLGLSAKATTQADNYTSVLLPVASHEKVRIAGCEHQPCEEKDGRCDDHWYQLVRKQSDNKSHHDENQQSCDYEAMQVSLRDIKSPGGESSDLDLSDIVVVVGPEPTKVLSWQDVYLRSKLLQERKENPISRVLFLPVEVSKQILKLTSGWIQGRD